jgi:hypothetical protein
VVPLKEDWSTTNDKDQYLHQDKPEGSLILLDFVSQNNSKSTSDYKVFRYFQEDPTITFEETNLSILAYNNTNKVQSLVSKKFVSNFNILKNDKIAVKNVKINLDDRGEATGICLVNTNGDLKYNAVYKLGETGQIGYLTGMGTFSDGFPSGTGNVVLYEAVQKRLDTFRDIGPQMIIVAESVPKNGEFVITAKSRVDESGPVLDNFNKINVWKMTGFYDLPHIAKQQVNFKEYYLQDVLFGDSADSGAVDVKVLETYPGLFQTNGQANFAVKEPSQVKISNSYPLKRIF